MEVHPCIFNIPSYVCMCKSYCFFLGGEGVSLGLLPFRPQKHYKKMFFWGLWKLDFHFFWSKSRVNNLATVESITRPPFCGHFGGTCGQVIDPTVFMQACFLKALLFFQKSHYPCRKKNLFEKHKRQQNKGGQVIDPTSLKMWPGYWPYSMHIYIYIYAVESKFGPRIAFFASTFGPSFSFLFFKNFLFLQGKWDKKKKNWRKKLQTHPNLQRPVWVDRKDADQTHPNL